MGDVAAGIVAALVGMATVFVILGILAGSVALMGRWAGGLQARPAVCQRGEAGRPQPHEQREIAALVSAILAHSAGAPPLAGEYVLRVDGAQRTLRVVEWGPEGAVVEPGGQGRTAVRVQEDPGRGER